MIYIHFKNIYHLGDCLFQLEFQQKLENVNPDLKCILHCDKKYHKELLKAYPDAELLDLNGDKDYKQFDTWIGKIPTYLFMNYSYNECYRNWFTEICKELNLVNPIKEKSDMLFCNKKIFETEVNSCDVLLIDCVPMSGQFDFSKRHFDDLERIYSKKQLSILRVSKLDLSLVEIAGIKTKLIHGIHTSPLLMLFNKKNENTNFIVYDHYNHFDFWSENYTYVLNDNKMRQLTKTLERTENVFRKFTLR